MDVLDQLFAVVNCWLQRLGRELPAAVQVTAGQRTTVVSVNYAVGVEHRDDFEDKIFPQQAGFLIIRIRQKVQNASHHPAANGLAGVDSG